MVNRYNSVTTLYTLESLSSGRSCIHRLHPGAKIITAGLFMVTVISFDRYSPGRIVPFLIYPSILIALGDIPLGMLMRRTALALPFCVFAGISNLVFEQDIALVVGGIGISFGLLSFLTLLLRTLLCVAAVLILAATTPVTRLAAQLRRFRCPALFVTILEISYRYIAVLMTEAASMHTAYLLRGGGTKGIAIPHTGSFIGHLFLHSVDRAERVYAAMKCRGYSLDGRPQTPQAFTFRDGIFLALVGLGCLIFRMIDVAACVGFGIGRVLSL
ncbi:cobalt ECF transporter T component CbiQ [Spirochaetia bacterium]|nr:cobalt ECF transporter T component CbiQ [Spirochaetia bacterium]